jgi:hypothetical protein
MQTYIHIYIHTHNTQYTIHNTQCTTHNTQHTIHNTQKTTHNKQHTIQAIPVVVVFRALGFISGKCITIIDTIIHHILNNYTNDAYI